MTIWRFPETVHAADAPSEQDALPPAAIEDLKAATSFAYVAFFEDESGRPRHWVMREAAIAAFAALDDGGANTHRVFVVNPEQEV